MGERIGAEACSPFLLRKASVRISDHKNGGKEGNPTEKATLSLSLSKSSERRIKNENEAPIYPIL